MEIEGLIGAIAGNMLTVSGQRVVAPPSVIVRHGSRVLRFTDLKVGDRVHIRASFVLEVLTASEVKLQNQGGDVDEDDGDDNEEIVIDGLIANLTEAGTCPARRFTIVSALVQTSAATVYINATCATLTNGAHVKVKGTIQPVLSTAGGPIILASRIEVVSSLSNPSVLEGLITRLSGACPNRTFAIDNSTMVSANAATVYVNATCATLTNGAHVKVTAVPTDPLLPPSQVIVASKIEVVP